MFFVTHSIEEAVYLGDRVYLLSSSPGTILEEIEVEPPDRPAREMQREPTFQETVYYIRDLIAKLEEEALSRGASGRYLKAAFLNHWNLLAFGAGTVFAFLSGQPGRRPAARRRRRDRLPRLLGTHPKFQKAVDAQEAKETRQVGAATRGGGPRADHAPPCRRVAWRRYEALRARAPRAAPDRRWTCGAPAAGERAAALREPPAPGPRPAAVDLPAAALHAVRRWRASWTGRASRRSRPTSTRLEEQLAAYAADEANPRRAEGPPDARATTSRPRRRAWRTSRRPARTTSSCSSRSTVSRTRSAR